MLRLATNKNRDTDLMQMQQYPFEMHTRMILVRAAKAVANLHSHRIHRDIKPENILVKTSPELEIKLSNFRNSCPDVFQDNDSSLPKSIYRNNKMGWPAGSPCHDSYALGVIFLENLKTTYFFREKAWNVQ